MKRREFCQTISFSLASGTFLTASGAMGIGAIVRTGKRELKLSLAAYSMRKFLQPRGGQEPSLDLPGFIDYCGRLGLDGTELTSYYFPEEVTPKYLGKLKSRSKKAGLEISSGAIRNDFCLPPGPELEKWIAHTKKWIDIYAELGAPTIRVFSGKVPKGDTPLVAIRRCIGVLEQVCEFAGKRGIFLALENHGGISATADSMLQIIRGVQSPWFGVNFDSGNFRSDDPYAELARIAPYAVSAQVKVQIRSKDKKVPADLARTVAILTDAGYSGWIILEYEASQDPYQAIPRYIKELRGILEEISC